MKKIITLTMTLLLFALHSCKETKSAAQNSSKEIVSGKYEIKSIQESLLSNKLFFEIDASKNKLYGKTGCNTFSGSYTVSENNITIGPLVSTKMYCEKNVMKVENSLFEAFSNAQTFIFDNNMLTLAKEDGSLMLKAYRITKKDN